MGKMHKLNIDENSLNRGNVIVDSGTTDTYFTSALGPHFKAMWKELMGEAYTHSPKSLTPQQIDAMPTIILIMQGYEGDAVGDEANGDPNSVAGYVGDVGELSSNPKDIVLAIPAAHYMEYDPDNGKYVARFYTEESSGSVLGANAMMGHDVFFDIARGRIGFAESNCDYVSLLLSEGTTISVSPHSGASQVSTKTETAVVPEQETAEEEKEMEEEEEMVEKVAEEVYEEAQESEKEETPAVPGSGTPSSTEQSTANNKNDEPSTPYELFNENNKPQGTRSGTTGDGFSGMAAVILDDMKHECGSNECRGIAALFIFGAGIVVLLGIRKAVARRRVVREYQEAELEISDLALDSDSDDEQGGYVDEPHLHQIS